MINAKKLIMLALCTFCFSVILKAQVEKEEEKVHIPESYQEAQQQIENDESVGTSSDNNDESVGTSSYNIDESNVESTTESTGETEQGAAAWRDDSEEEELRVYSGSHDGNNFVKTIKVKKAVDGDAGYKPGQVYQPH